jgi:AAA15 family ATPase/GTPase
MLDKITFKNYKLFKREQTLELKPITVLIGKNSSGKTAVTKLLPLLEASLSGQYSPPVVNSHNGIELFSSFSDLLYGRSKVGNLKLKIYENNQSLEVIIGADQQSKGKPIILNWRLFDIKRKKLEHDLTSNNSFNGFYLHHVKLSCSTKSDYIGPFRTIPDRTYTPSSPTQFERVGFEGRDAYKLLIHDTFSDYALVNKVSQWYQENFEGWGIRINEDKDPHWEIELTRNNGTLNVNLLDVGEGMSQALPLVTRAYMPVKDEMTIVMEQPELHLHPAAHGNMAELFVDTMEKGKKHYMIETHSQNFVLRLRRLVAEGKLSKDDLQIYFVDFDEELHESNLKAIKVHDDGGVDNWPKGVFSEAFDETIAIRNAQRERE